MSNNLSKKKPAKPRSKSTPYPNKDQKDHDVAVLLELFKYRNIAWRYLLCYCLPSQQKILIKQLRIAHERKSSLYKSDDNIKSKNKSIFDTFSKLFDDNKDNQQTNKQNKNKNKNNNNDNDDDIPDFYHLPRISLNELQTLFKDGREKYELLKKIYVNDTQQTIRDDSMKATAPPSEQYNNPSLRNRSKSITDLLIRENQNSSAVFSRIDLINSDWKNQDKMNKINQLRQAPPTYAPPPKPAPSVVSLPKPSPFIPKSDAIHSNFEHHNSSKHKTRGRFNTFTSDNLSSLTHKLHIKKLNKKNKKSKIKIDTSSGFKMKIFQNNKKKNKNKKNKYNENAVQLINSKIQKPRLANTFSNPVSVATAAPPRGRQKRRTFSDVHFGPFSALSTMSGKNSKFTPITPPPRIPSLSSVSKNNNSNYNKFKRKSFSYNPFAAFSNTNIFRPKTPPPPIKKDKDKNKKKDKNKNKIRSKSPLSSLMNRNKTTPVLTLSQMLSQPLVQDDDDIDDNKTDDISHINKAVLKKRRSFKNPSLSLSCEDLDFINRGRTGSYSDDDNDFINSTDDDLFVSRRKKPRSRSEADIKYVRKPVDNDIKTKSTSTQKNNGNKNDKDNNDNKDKDVATKQSFVSQLNQSTLNILPDEEEEDDNDNDDDNDIDYNYTLIDKIHADNVSDDITKSKKNKNIIEVVEDDGSSDDAGTLLMVTKNDTDDYLLSSSNSNDDTPQSLVVAPPTTKNSGGTITIVAKSVNTKNNNNTINSSLVPADKTKNLPKMNIKKNKMPKGVTGVMPGGKKKKDNKKKKQIKGFRTKLNTTTTTAKQNNLNKLNKNDNNLATLTPLKKPIDDDDDDDDPVTSPIVIHMSTTDKARISDKNNLKSNLNNNDIKDDDDKDNINDNDTEYDVKVTQPPDNQLKELDDIDDTIVHPRMKHDAPTVGIDIDHLVPGMDKQRRRESVVLDEDGDEYKQIQKDRDDRIKIIEKRKGINADLVSDDDLFKTQTQSGLFSDVSDNDNDKDKASDDDNKDDDDPVNSSPSPSSSNLEMVNKHPLKSDNDDDGLNDIIAPLVTKSMDDLVINKKKLFKRSQTKSKIDHNAMHKSYKSSRRNKKGHRRGQSMAANFTPSYLKEIHNVHPISDDENNQLWKQIMKDVNRTFQYREFFRNKTTKKSLGNLLYIWSRINHKVGYLQGMHDLASIIICAVFFDYKIYDKSTDNSNSDIDENYDEEKDGKNYDDDDDAISQDNAVLQDLLDPLYLEHDVYAIYDSLLQLTVKFFEAAVPPSQQDNNNNNNNIAAHLNRGLFDSGTNCSLYLKLHYLQHKLLKHFDLVLYTHFEKIGLSPQLYMLRWIRVLFSREFYLDQIINLWDEMFVSSNLIEFIDYVVMAMIHNVRNELLKKRDMTAIAILQNYPKDKINISSLALIARRIQRGEIKFDLDRELYNKVKTKEKIMEYSQQATYLYNEIKDYISYPQRKINDKNNDDNNNKKIIYDYMRGPDIRIPGFGNITPTQKYNVKKIIYLHYGINMPNNGPIRQGYLVKRGSGDQGIFARKNFKIRWFVIDKDFKFWYYKNRKSYNKNEDALRPAVKLSGRAVRVVNSDYFCFEVSGIKISKRAYLLFAKNFDDFVLWLHALMWCADKSLYDIDH